MDALSTSEEPDGRLGVGPLLPGIDAAKSWHGAGTALRYTSDGEPVVWWDRLGGLALMAGQVDAGDIAALPDVLALDRPAGEQGMITLLDALCATGSAREAAAVLHRHHSTMTARLARAESVPGSGLDEAPGRFRLHLALMSRRLRDNATH